MFDLFFSLKLDDGQMPWYKISVMLISLWKGVTHPTVYPTRHPKTLAIEVQVGSPHKPDTFGVYTGTDLAFTREEQQIRLPCKMDASGTSATFLILRSKKAQKDQHVIYHYSVMTWGGNFYAPHSETIGMTLQENYNDSWFMTLGNLGVELPDYVPQAFR